MGRKVRITREMIINAAYELLDESGINAVAIKSIAAKLNCSTQPVSWQFGSMAELKKELYSYAVNKMYGSLEEQMKGKDAVEAFFVSGVNYISNACDHPHVFKFVNVDDPMDTIGERPHGEASIFSRQFDEGALKIFADQYDVPADQLAEMVRDTVIYTHGLAMMMMFDNYRLPKEEACRMMYNAGAKMMKAIGITAPEAL
ncbi:MAG: TetR/AcrR family transcriptional regulator [Lachnospiraceae bacterium]|nr:TetR/AcrR family transcriptional regulator [Lachnospiraceae bacterium]